MPSAPIQVGVASSGAINSDKTSSSFVPTCPPEAVRPDGWIAVLGIGSLLSERSARHTSPNLRNFRTARVKGWRRVFAHTAPVFFERGIARPETREISSLSMEPIVEGGMAASSETWAAAHGPDGLLATYFEIPGEEFPALAAREAEFELTAVTARDGRDRHKLLPAAILCTRSSDASYVERYCVREGEADADGRKDEACGCVACTLRGYGERKIWFPPTGRKPTAEAATASRGNPGEGVGDDAPGVSILPCRVYARHCVLAARSLVGAPGGEEAEASFLEHTFLSDRVTTLRQYLEENPSIMEETPPPSLVDRYSG